MSDWLAGAVRTIEECAFRERLDRAHANHRDTPPSFGDRHYAWRRFREVQAADARTLERLGVCHEPVASALESVLLGANLHHHEPAYRLAVVEGTGSHYRVDPERFARILELEKHAIQ